MLLKEVGFSKQQFINVVFIAHAQLPLINARADIQRSLSLIFGLNLNLYPYCYMRAAKGQASLRICADWPEPLLLAALIYTEISCTAHSVEVPFSNVIS